MAESATSVVVARSEVFKMVDVLAFTVVSASFGDSDVPPQADRASTRKASRGTNRTRCLISIKITMPP